MRVNWKTRSRALGQGKTRLTERQVEQILGLQQKLLCFTGPKTP